MGQGQWIQAPSSKPQAPSEPKNKAQASSPKLQASSLKPIFFKSLIREPWKSFTSLGPRASAKIKVFLGCATWNAIWCGENLSLLLEVTFNSRVKKCPELVYPNRSGHPSKLRFSIRVQIILGVLVLSFLYNLASGPMRFLG